MTTLYLVLPKTVHLRAATAIRTWRPKAVQVGSRATIRLSLAALLGCVLAGCASTGENFSQYPGFSVYLKTYPTPDEQPSERGQHLLDAFRPRFFVPSGETGPIDFYADYIANGRLYDGEGELISDQVDRELLNAYRDDPGVVFVHIPPSEEASSGEPSAAVPARIGQDRLQLPGMAGPQKVLFLSYHLVFPRSGLAAGIPGWHRRLMNLIGDADDWHQLDHSEVTLALVPKRDVPIDAAGAEDLIPFAAILQQHNYMRTYVLVDDPELADHPGRMLMDNERRIAVDVAEGSHALFPHAPERRWHRAVRFLRPDNARYLVGVKPKPLPTDDVFTQLGRRLMENRGRPALATQDITHPGRRVSYELAFLPPNDAFYSFQGSLGEQRLLPGRDGPPGAMYDPSPALQRKRIQLAVFFWQEGMGNYPRDLSRVALDTWHPPDREALTPFQRRLVTALPCRDDWPLPCARDL